MSVAISKLTFNLDDVEKQLKNVVSVAATLIVMTPRTGFWLGRVCCLCRGGLWFTLYVMVAAEPGVFGEKSFAMQLCCCDGPALYVVLMIYSRTRRLQHTMRTCLYKPPVYQTSRGL